MLICDQLFLPDFFELDNTLSSTETQETEDIKREYRTNPM